MVLVNGLDAWVRTDDRIVPISSQRYVPEVIHPDGIARLTDFQAEPWPRWTYKIGKDLFVEHDFFVPRGASVSVLRWRLRGNAAASLLVRPFLSGRDFHATHHENGLLNFSAEIAEDRVTWNPYPEPQVTARSNGCVGSEPTGMKLRLPEERARELDLGGFGRWKSI
jgi:glycogen debranching enzyme